MNNPNYPASGFPTQPQTSSTPMPTNSSPVQQDGNIQQLGSTQSSFVNQFVNENQQSMPQQINPTGLTSNPVGLTGSPMGPTSDALNVSPPVQSQSQNDAMPAAPSTPTLNTFSNPEPAGLPKLEDNDDFALPSLNNNPSFTQNETPAVEMPNAQAPTFNDSGMVSQNMDTSQALDQQPVESTDTTPIGNLNTPVPNNSPTDQGNFNPAPTVLGNEQLQVPQNNLQPNSPVMTATPINNDPQGIGTHQITVNEDYADYYNRQQAAMQMNGLNKQIEPSVIDFSRPATTLNVDQDFSDGGLPASDNSGISTGFLPAFDDISDDGILPVVTDDDADNGDADPEEITSGNAFVPYGFSDFDPNEQDAGPMVDHLSTFESQSLEDTADKIDVDYSEQMPPIGSTQQSNSVFTQEPAVATQPSVSAPVQTLNYMNQTPQVNNQSNTIQQVGGQSFVPVNTSNDLMQTPKTSVPDVEPVVGELSPAARLNQLLEAEEAAEKVVMQKQDQMLDKAPETQQSRESKVNVFKQLDPDASLDSDLKSQMSVKKPSSKYFLIFSVVIIISIIGFLLVLLGLMLL